MPGPVFVAGETLNLRTIEEEDLPFLQQAVNDARVWRAIGWPHPVNAAQEETFFEEQVCDREIVNLLVTVSEEPVGIVSLQAFDHELARAELGYWIAPEFHDQGYGSEATALLVTYGFDQRALNRIEARVFEFNKGSQALLESLGFTHEGTLRERQFADGERQDVLWYGLLAREWDGGG